MLKMTTYGAANPGIPILIVPGLFGQGRNWRAIARRLAQGGRRVVTVDMRNHGESPWADSHSYPEMAEDLSRVIATLGGRADVIGHSMGGKAAMVLALRHPDMVRRLVVADIAPVAYDHSMTHLIEAMQAIDPARIATRAEADAALAERIDDPRLRAFLLGSLDLRNRRWLLNLDVLAREMATITGFPEVSGRFDGPVLFLSGGNSDYVRPEHRARIRALFPKARFARIPDAGHWLHAERPRAFIETVQTFLGSG